MKKVIMFGASGNSGQKIVKRLVKDGFEVVGLGRSKSPYDSMPEVEYHQGDIQDKDFVNSLPKYDYHAVLNFAGVQPSILQYSESTDLEKTLHDYINVNINGVFNVLEFCRKREIPRYIYTTSHRDIEGHWESGKLLHPDLPYSINYGGDHVMYAITKTSALMMGDYYRSLLGMKVFNLRLPMVFSLPNKNWYYAHGQKRIIPFLQIIRNAMLGKPLEIWGDKNMQRDYVHMDNLEQLINLCLDADVSGGTYNVGTGEAVTTENFIKNIAEVFSPHGANCEFIYKPEKKTYKCASYDITKEREELGYDPIMLNGMLLRLKEEIEKAQAFDKWQWEY